MCLITNLPATACPWQARFSHQPRQARSDYKRQICCITSLAQRPLALWTTKPMNVALQRPSDGFRIASVKQGGSGFFLNQPKPITGAGRTHQFGWAAVSDFAVSSASSADENNPKHVAPDPDMRASMHPFWSDSALITVPITGANAIAGACRSLR